MKKSKWTLGIVMIAALALAVGCGKGDDEHAGHNHGDGEHGHSHGEGGGHDHDGEGHDKKGEGTGHDHDGDKGHGAAMASKAGDAKPYTLDVCIVSDEKLGSMGKAISKVHEGQEVKFCCDSCVPDFTKEPAKYLTKLTK